jgi:aminopeptidase N
MCGHHRHPRRTDAAARPVIADDPDLRASDAERERAVDDLRAHAAEGRLTVEELEQRTAAALAARTHRDLAALAADLPRAPRPRQELARARAEFADHLRTYLLVMALLVAIWALTGAGYFWPVWPALGWGIGVASHRMPLGGHGRHRAALRA